MSLLAILGLSLLLTSLMGMRLELYIAPFNFGCRACNIVCVCSCGEVFPAWIVITLYYVDGPLCANAISFKLPPLLEALL